MMAFTEGKTKRECCLFWGGWHRSMDENKKSGCGDVRVGSLSWYGEWEKSLKTSVHPFSHSRPSGEGLRRGGR